MAVTVMSGLVDTANHGISYITTTCHYCGSDKMYMDHFSDCVKCKCGAMYTMTMMSSPSWITKPPPMTREKAIARNNGA